MGYKIDKLKAHAVEFGEWLGQEMEWCNLHHKYRVKNVSSFDRFTSAKCYELFIEATKCEK